MRRINPRGDENQRVLHELRLPHRDVEESTQADDGRDPDTDEHPSPFVCRHPDAEPERDRKEERKKSSEQNEKIAFGERENHLGRNLWALWRCTGGGEEFIRMIFLGSSFLRQDSGLIQDEPKPSWCQRGWCQAVRRGPSKTSIWGQAGAT